MPADNYPDLGAVGAAARVSKRDTAGGSKELTNFSVRKGDNGGVLVCETYESKPPEGRRTGSAFQNSSKYLENPFGPDDQDKARVHVTALLGQMTGGGAMPGAGGPVAPRPPVLPRVPPPPPRPPALAPPPPPPGPGMAPPPGMGEPGPVVTGRRPTPLRPPMPGPGGF